VAVQPLFNKRLEPFTRAIAQIGTWDAEAIHQSRVGSRRLRELVPVLEIDHNVQRRVGKQLRQVTRRLGKLREADVQAQILDEFRRKGHDNRAVDRLEQAIADEIRQTREWLTRRLGERHRERLVGTLAHIAQQLDAREAASRPVRSRRPSIWLSTIDARAARRAARLQSAIDRAGAMYSPDALHDVRIAVKKLRYALEVSHEARGQDDVGAMRLLKRAQNTLGRLHDLEMLVKRVRQAELDADSDLLRELEQLAETADLECRELHGRFMKARSSIAAVADNLARPAPSSMAARRRAAG
jgi:CHAD domain-containing protein